MKKLLAMLLALGLLALCACTSKSNTTAEVPETMTETPSEETEQTDSAEDADAAEETDETAAEVASLAPHGSKARLLDEPNRRGSWRSHVHRTHTAQRVQSFKLQSLNVGGRGGLPSSFLLGV